MKIEKPNFKVVNWILEFLADDLDNISDLEFSKRLLDAEYYFVDQWGYKWPGFGPPMTSPSANPSMEKMHKKGTPAEERAAFSPSRYFHNYPFRETLKEIQASLKQIAKELSQKQPGNEDVGREVGKVSLVFYRGPEGMFIKFNPLSSLLDLPHFPKPEKLMELAKLTFYISADGLPQNAIIPCRECSKYFLHVSKKVKYFCSPRCASRNLSRERREKDPEGYRTKQREIMRRKYKEKKAKELGRPVEKIAFQKKSISKKANAAEVRT